MIEKLRKIHDGTASEFQNLILNLIQSVSMTIQFDIRYQTVTVNTEYHCDSQTLNLMQIE
jgi:hypothetical protein